MRTNAFRRTRLDIYYNAYRLRLAEAACHRLRNPQGLHRRRSLRRHRPRLHRSAPLGSRNVRWSRHRPISCATARLCGSADNGRPRAIRVDMAGFRCGGYPALRFEALPRCSGSLAGLRARRTRRFTSSNAHQCRRSLEQLRMRTRHRAGSCPTVALGDMAQAVLALLPLARNRRSWDTGCPVHHSILAKSATGCASGLPEGRPRRVRRRCCAAGGRRRIASLKPPSGRGLGVATALQWLHFASERPGGA